MAKTKPLDLLKKWEANKTTVIVTGADKLNVRLVEHRAKVLHVDPSKAILTTIEGTPQTKAIDLGQVRLSIPDGVKGIEVRWPSNENTLIREE